MSHYTDLRDVAHALGRCYEAEGHDCSPAGIEDLLARVEELKKIEREHAELGETMTIDSWHEDDGAALWWRFPVAEPPYCGTPLDDDFPDYVTHWTRLHDPPLVPFDALEPPRDLSRVAVRTCPISGLESHR